MIDNYTLIKEKLTDVFGEIENNLSGESPVFLKASANFNQKQSLLENSFNEHFSLKGKSVYISPAETFLDLLKMKQEGYLVSVTAEVLNVEYKNNIENNSGKKLSREIIVKVFCSIINRIDGKVIVSETITKEYIDNIFERDVDLIENRDIPFTISEIPKNKSFKDLFELGAVITAAGTIIYLLFSTRS
ncbi:hypothetical protein ACFL5P_02700 [candidate division KSB1 bacterium]